MKLFCAVDINKSVVDVEVRNFSMLYGCNKHYYILSNYAYKTKR